MRRRKGQKKEEEEEEDKFARLKGERRREINEANKSLCQSPSRCKTPEPSIHPQVSCLPHSVFVGKECFSDFFIFHLFFFFFYFFFSNILGIAMVFLFFSFLLDLFFHFKYLGVFTSYTSILVTHTVFTHSFIHSFPHSLSTNPLSNLL